MAGDDDGVGGRKPSNYGGKSFSNAADGSGEG